MTVVPSVARVGLAVLAGGALGLVIAGIGSRVAMRLIAIADNREDFGFRTDSGATVGEFTLRGTAAVLLNGILLGIVGGLLYLVVRRWLPRPSLARSLTFAALVIGPGLFLVVRGNEGDFEFVAPVLSVVLFGVLLALYGAVLPLVVDRTAPPRRLSRSRALPLAVAGIAAATFLALSTDAVVHALELARGSR